MPRYKWHDRAPTARQLRKTALCQRVTALFKASRSTYGSPRIHQDLVVEGWTVSVNTVAAVMDELGLSGRKKPKRRGSTRPGRRPVARDLVRRNFDAVAPDVLTTDQQGPSPGSRRLTGVSTVRGDGQRTRTIRGSTI